MIMTIMITTLMLIVAMMMITKIRITMTKTMIMITTLTLMVAMIRELTNRRLSHDEVVRLRDVTSAHTNTGTCQSRAKVNDAKVDEGDLHAYRKRTWGYLWKFSECFFLMLQAFLFSHKSLIKDQSSSWLMFLIVFVCFCFLFSWNWFK